MKKWCIIDNEAGTITGVDLNNVAHFKYIDNVAPALYLTFNGTEQVEAYYGETARTIYKKLTEQ